MFQLSTQPGHIDAEVMRVVDVTRSPDFAQELAERAERADAPDSAGVTLASLHAAS